MAMAAAVIKREPACDEWELLSDGASTVNLEDAIVPETDEPVVPEPSTSNPVGELQELCVKKSWAFPMYKEEYKSGLPHLTTFVITCNVKGLSVSGSGSSKKRAKTASAAAMLVKLKEAPQSGELEQQRSVPLELTEIENTLNQLTISAGDDCPDLVTAAEIEAQLKNLAEKYSVTITSRAGSDIEGRSVWICELEGAVVTGYGSTPKEARIDAAKGVVHRLRMKILD